VKSKEEKRIRLKRKIRAKIFGTKERPRLAVFRSSRFVYAQIIDDEKGRTLAAASDLKAKKGTKVEKAKGVGKAIAEKAKTAKIKSVVFDRGGFKYTGRVRSVAEAAREAGLNF